MDSEALAELNALPAGPEQVSAARDCLVAIFSGFERDENGALMRRCEEIIREDAKRQLEAENVGADSSGS
jgi:hypothetical protein